MSWPLGVNKNHIFIMKTIDGYKAQALISRFSIAFNSALNNFERTGILLQDKVKDYHSELDEMLSNSHMYLKKEIEYLQLLKNYFNKYAPLPVTPLRDPSNIKTLEYHSSVPGYEYEKTIFDITWNELIIYFPGEHSKQSISLNDAKKLAAAILEKP